jgi:RimJ/RimL family protein N-acetyltransferase
VALKLRETVAPDLSEVMAIESDPDVSPWITAWSVDRHRRALAETDEAHMIFSRRGRTVGFLLLAGLTRPDRSIELRRIALSCRGEGLGAAAMDLALGYTFDVLRARRVWLDVLPANARALRLYERVGFADDGPAPHGHLLPDGSSIPLRLMSITETAFARAPHGRGDRAAS